MWRVAGTDPILAVVALEDGFPVKQWLAEADLVIAMLDVRALEAEE